MARVSLHCDSTDLTIYINDIVTISDYPNVKYIVKKGWHDEGGKKVNNWYFVSIGDKTILSLDQVNMDHLWKDMGAGLSKDTLEPDSIEVKEAPAPSGPSLVEEIPEEALNPVTKDMDAPTDYNYIVIPNTDIRLYDGDLVKLTNRPDTKWIVHHGWFNLNNTSKYDWYLASIPDNEILPVSSIDLSLCTLLTVKTQGSNEYDGRVVNYTKPFTDADAAILARAFITVDTIEQRDNLDPKKIVNGKLVRVNDVEGEVEYYDWDAKAGVWVKADLGGGAKMEPIDDAFIYSLFGIEVTNG